MYSSVWYFLLNIMFLNFIHVVAYIYCLSILLLMDTWAVSSMGLL